MTYTTLVSTTKLSELAGILNGVTTRRSNLILDLASSGSPAARNSAGRTPTWDFTVSDIAFAIWPIPSRIDRAVDMTLRLWGAPATSEASRQISMDVEILSLDSVAATLLGAAATGTLQLVDQAVDGTALTLEEFSLTVAAATYLGSNVDTLAIRFLRQAATTDLVGDWRLAAAALDWTIER